MSWLERLKKTAVVPCAPPTKPTEPGFVGFVGNPAALSKNSAGEADAANDAAPPPDPDLYCWPHTTAMTTGEIDTFMRRLERFTDKGMGLNEAERLAAKLVMRDREADDRRLCLECSHLAGAGRWSCGNAARAGVSAQGLARELVTMPQRCQGFTP
jgi:hypothetical protein